MSSIDERIVEMRFRNGEFEKGVSQTSASLRDLKKNLNLEGAASGLDAVGKAAAHIRFDGMANDLASVNSKMSIFGVSAFTVIQSLTNSAIGFGKTLISNVMDPLIEGGKRRAQNIEQAKFMLDGLKVAWADIEPAISGAVRGTAFGLDEAARAASSLVASNVPLDRMETSLRAISGVAAMTGSSYTDMAQVFTTVAGNGRLMASELNRIGQRGLNAAAALGDFLGVSEEAARKLTSEGAISFEIFASAMDQAFGEQSQKANDTYSGSLANVRAALSRIGEIPAAARMEKLRNIFNALSPQIDAVKNALKPLLGYFGELQVQSGKNIASFISSIDLSQLEPGFQNIIDGFKNIMEVVSETGARINKVFTKAFPKTPGTWFVTLTGWFKSLTEALKPTEKMFNNFETVLSIVAGVLSVVVTAVSALWSVMKAVGGVISVVIGLLWDLVKPFLGIGGASDETGDAIGSFFEMLRKGINEGVKPVIEWLNKLRDALQALRDGDSSGNKYLDAIYNTIKKFSEFSSGKITDFLSGFKEAIKELVSKGNMDRVKEFFSLFDPRNMDLGGLKSLGTWSGDVFMSIVKFVRDAWSEIKVLAPEIGKNLGRALDVIVEFINGISANDVMVALQSGGIVAVLVMIWKHMSAVNGLLKSASGVLDSVSKTLTSFQDHLAAIQKSMKVNNFLKIAVAIGILAAALWVLSGIPTDKLIAGGIALGLIAAGLMIMYRALNKMTEAMTPEHAAAMTTTATSMIVMSGAVLMLAFAVEKMSKIDMWGLIRGVSAVIAILFALAGAARLMSAGNRVLVSSAFAVGVFASALWILVDVVKRFAKMDGDALLKGGLTAAAAIAVLAGAMTLMSLPKNNVNVAKAGLAILMMVGSLLILQGAMQKFADMDAGAIAKGGSIAAVALAALAGTAALMSRFAPNAITGAAAIAIMAGSLVVIGFALEKVASIDGGGLLGAVLSLSAVVLVLGFIAKSLSGIDGVLGAASVVILAGALWLISDAISNIADVDTGKLIGIAIGLGIILGVITLLGYIAGQAPLVIVAILAIGLAVAAIAAVLFGVATIIQSAANLISAATEAMAFFVNNAQGIADGLMTLAKAAEEMEPYVGTLLKTGGSLLIFGLGAAVAGVGILILGAGLVVLAAGLAAVALFGPMGTAALTAMTAELLPLADRAWDLMNIGAGLLVLGIGMAAVGIGGLLAAAGGWAMAMALDVLTPALDGAAPMLERLATAAKKSADGILPLIGLGVGLAAFGAGAIIAGVGAGLLGGALLLMGMGLALVKSHGPSGAKAVVKVAEALAPLWKEAVQLGIAATALGAIGAALVVLGAGLTASGIGAGLFAAAGMLLMMVLPRMQSSLQRFADQFPEMVTTVETSLTQLASAVEKGASTVSTAVSTMATTIGAALPAVSSAFTTLGTSITTAMGSGISQGMSGASAVVIMGIMGIILRAAVMVMSMSPSFVPGGMMIGMAISMGIRSSTGVVMASVLVVTQAANMALRSSRGQTQASGLYVMTGFANGVRSASGMVSSAGSQVARALIGGLQSGLWAASAVGRSGGFSVGLAISQGAQAGVSAGAGGVVAAVQSMARSAVAAAKSELDIHSPSRKFFWIGSMMTAGTSNAVTVGTRDVVRSVRTMGDAAVTTLGAAMGQISDISVFDMDMSPRIRPVVDLSGVESSTKRLSEMFDRAPIVAEFTASMAANHVAAVESSAMSREAHASGGAASYTFEQNIYSPKAVSTSEVYRQTRSLVGSSRGQGENR